MLTSVQLKEEDHKFCKEMGFKFSELLRSAIDEKRKLHAGIVVDNVLEERRKKENFIKISEDMRAFINEKGLIDEFLERGK